MPRSVQPPWQRRASHAGPETGPPRGRTLYDSLASGGNRVRRRVLVSMMAGMATPAGWTEAGERASAGAKDDEVVISLMPYSGIERRQFDAWVARFNAEHPGLHARIVATAPETYKTELAGRLASGTDQADLYYWFAGTRMRELAGRGLIAPLDDVWRANDLAQAFSPALTQAVSWRGRPFAVPLNYYQWGFYYRPSTFARAGLAVPATWQEMRALAAKARTLGMAPTVLGLGDPWASAAWFDYFDLRLNGLAFHLALTQGQVAFTDARVRAVFEAWRTVRDEQWYLADARELTWREAAPYLLRDRAATYLMGNFFESALPDAVRADVGFFPFPQMRSRMPDYEDGPTDVLMLSARARHRAAAATFLAWTCRPEIQQMLAEPYGKLATHRALPLPQDPLARAGAGLLREAAGIAQYFDRDCAGELAAAGIQVFNAFVRAGLSVGGAQAQLEAARQRPPARR